MTPEEFETLKAKFIKGLMTRDEVREKFGLPPLKAEVYAPFALTTTSAFSSQSTVVAQYSSAMQYETPHVRYETNWRYETDDRHKCAYCGAYSKDDARGNCANCGAPRGRL